MLAGRPNFRKVDEPVGAPGDYEPTLTMGGRPATIGVRHPERPSPPLASVVERAHVPAPLTRDIDYLEDVRTLEVLVARSPRGAFSTTARPM